MAVYTGESHMEDLFSFRNSNFASNTGDLFLIHEDDPVVDLPDKPHLMGDNDHGQG